MTTQEFYDEHIELLKTNDAVKLAELHYHPDATMLILTGDEPMYAQGIEAITNLFKGYLEYVYRGFISTEKLALTDDSMFLEATIDTVNGPLKVYDAMYLKDSKIYGHFTGVK